ncbi:tyrosine-type recombinase/integrase [Vibrio parahaemolyticus]|nr:tyrosine-type recombinase/integrase [Vibrio parahaemolyticus]
MSLMQLPKIGSIQNIPSIQLSNGKQIELNTDIRPDRIRSLGLLPEQVHQSPELLAFSEKFLEEFKFVRGGLRDRSWNELQNKWSQFFNYCLSNQLVPLPASHDTVFEYIRLRSKVLHRSTLKRDMWAINAIHNAAGFMKPCDDQAIKNFVKRVSEEQAANGIFITQAVALLSIDLDEIEKEFKERRTVQSMRDRAILGLMFSCLLRGSELRNVKFEHVDLSRRKLLIPISKTNHSGEPDIAPISTKAAGWLNEYMTIAGEFGPGDFLFRGVSKYDKLFKSGKKQLSHDALVGVFHRGFDVVAYRKSPGRRFSCHSTRVGCCQALWEAGVPLEKIMKLGRWSTQEMAYRYGRAHKVSDDAIESVM